MKHTLSSAFIAGALASLPVALVEVLRADGGAFLASLLLAVGLILPVGLLVGLAMVALGGMLPATWRPSAAWRLLRSEDNPEVSGGILAVGLLALAGLAALYRIAFFFMTSFHHMGLASLALTVLLAVALPIIYLASWQCVVLLRRALSRIPLPVLRRPAVVLGIVIVAWAAALLPPLIRGPEATGPFGFAGFLKKDGLNAGPLVAVISIGGLSLVPLGGLLSRRSKGILLGGGLSFLAAALGIIGAHGIATGLPNAMDRVDSAEGLSAAVAATLRKLGDRDGDGHAAWMGGRDCDDSNPDVYPRAREIPDNGVDEDCSGADLRMAALKAAAGSGEKQKVDPSRLKRPTLPKDLSVILITIDSLRWNGTGFMGYEREVTPNLDRLLQNGTIYERAYALGSYTGQAVPPLMTGKYASELLRNDRHETRVSGRETFAAELICGGKVLCAGILSHFLFKERYGWSQGFDDWTVVGASPAGPGHIDSKYNSDHVANAALAWLRRPEHTAGQFFLWTHFMDPHKEYLRHKSFKSFGNDRRALYDQEVLFTDYHIGRMMKYFETLPAARRTIIIVTADHGEAFNEHGRWTHGKELWEEIIRVPLAIAGPGIPKKRIARQTSLIDFFPTLLDLFDRPIPEGTHGRSLLGDWVPEQTLPERFVVADQPKNPTYESRRVFIKDGWKLHDLPDTGSYRLYRLTDDYERGDSLAETETAAFEKIKAAYDIFLATGLSPVKPVEYEYGPVDKMPLPAGYTTK